MSHQQDRHAFLLHIVRTNKMLWFVCANGTSITSFRSHESNVKNQPVSFLQVFQHLHRPISLVEVEGKMLESIFKDVETGQLKTTIRQRQQGYLKYKLGLTNMFKCFEAVTSKINRKPCMWHIYMFIFDKRLMKFSARGY